MPPTFVTLPGGIYTPCPAFFPDNATPGFTNHGNISTSSETVGFVFRAPKSGVLDSLAFHLGAVVTPQDMEVSWRDVAISGGGAGFHDGTADQFYTIASASLVANGWNTTGVMTHDGTGGGTKRTVTQGDLIAAVFRLTGAGNVTFQVLTNDIQVNFPYATAFTFTVTGRSFPIAIKYDDGTYADLGPTQVPFKASVSSPSPFASDSTPDEVGNRFTPNFTRKVDACWVKVNRSQNFRVVLYDADGTSILTQTDDQDIDTIAANAKWNLYLPFLAEVTLNAGSTYRLVYKPTTTTASLSIVGYEVPSNALFAMTQEGISTYMTERTDAGAWTDTNTKRLIMGTRISALQTDPGGASAAHAFIG